MMGMIERGHLLSGRYRVEELVGRGGQSSVYRAVDELLERDVAVKVFHEGRHGDAAQARRQESEVRILAGMSHHGLVTLFDVGMNPTNASVSYLVMELVRGPDLRRRRAQSPVSAAHVALIGHDLADGLAYMHHHGIVHRDVKPANVLLVDYNHQDPRPRAKLSDFGVAMILGDDGHDDGIASGTPQYLSPEQAAGEPVGPSSDVYSLGLVLLEVLTGEVAFPGAPIQSALARLLHIRTSVRSGRTWRRVTRAGLVAAASGKIDGAEDAPAASICVESAYRGYEPSDRRPVVIPAAE